MVSYTVHSIELNKYRIAFIETKYFYDQMRKIYILVRTMIFNF